MNSEYRDLQDRINRVINTKAFEESLASRGLYIMDFQCDWHKYNSFDELPQIYKDAILNGKTYS